MKNDCNLIAKKNKIDFMWNDKFPINSLYLMRGYLFVNSDKKDKYFDLCFDAYWKNNEDISKEEVIKNILSKCEIKPNDFKKGIEDQKIKNELKNLTNIAFQNDVFGAPTFVVNNNLFWGQDRLEFALDELNNYVILNLLCFNAPKPPSIWDTFLNPISFKDFAARADLIPPAQNKTISLFKSSLPCLK